MKEPKEDLILVKVPDRQPFFSVLPFLELFKLLDGYGINTNRYSCISIYKFKNFPEYYHHMRYPNPDGSYSEDRICHFVVRLVEDHPLIPVDADIKPWDAAPNIESLFYLKTSDLDKIRKLIY